MYVERITKLQTCLPIWECDGVIIESPVDLFYLTGLRLSAGRLYVVKEKAQLFVDGRYFAVAQANSPVPVCMLDQQIQKEFITQENIRYLAFDSQAINYEQYVKYEIFSQTVKVSLVAIPSPLKNIRVIKSTLECEKMRETASLAKEGILYLYSLIIPGVSEKQLAWEFERFCRENGAQKMAFEPIIAFGENTSFPHHRSSDRLLQPDDPILIDVGCVLDGYASDVTRTIWNQGVPANFSHIHAVVRRAQKAALALCYPGARLGDLDLAARQIMREANMEELFVHSLGHGIGLETHEYPRISHKGDDRDIRLSEGMVITIEPGLYVRGICGARHEDTIIVQKDGPENLYHDLG